MFPFAASATKNSLAERLLGGPLVKVLMPCELAPGLTTCLRCCADGILMDA